MRGNVFKKSVIKGAISYAMNIGRTLREANENSLDAAAAIADKFGGKLLFRGTVEETPWEFRDGFTFAEVHLAGCDGFEGEKYEIFIQNENIYAKRNGELDICVPDLICMLDDKGRPVTNPNWTIGQKVSMIGLPASEIWKTPEGRKVFSTESFKLGFAYKPFL